MNKLLVNVDEVSEYTLYTIATAKAQADQVKGLMTGETKVFEKKGTGKICTKMFYS